MMIISFALWVDAMNQIKLQRNIFLSQLANMNISKLELPERDMKDFEALKASGQDQYYLKHHRPFKKLDPHKNHEALLDLLKKHMYRTQLKLVFDPHNMTELEQFFADIRNFSPALQPPHANFLMEMNQQLRIFSQGQQHLCRCCRKKLPKQALTCKSCKKMSFCSNVCRDKINIFHREECVYLQVNK
jgi:hypothetical protein